ncbi:hypothetical protein NQZ68_009231 [Dissostichus eleginoides]|nr:hypothetical protein NQZ68_009231 [Dissostichus eleginoides]
MTKLTAVDWGRGIEENRVSVHTHSSQRARIIAVTGLWSRGLTQEDEGMGTLMYHSSELRTLPLLQYENITVNVPLPQNEEHLPLLIHLHYSRGSGGLVLSCLVEIKGPRSCLPPCKPHHIRLAQWSPPLVPPRLEEHATKNLYGAKLRMFASPNCIKGQERTRRTGHSLIMSCTKTPLEETVRTVTLTSAGKASEDDPEHTERGAEPTADKGAQK